MPFDQLFAVETAQDVGNPAGGDPQPCGQFPGGDRIFQLGEPEEGCLLPACAVLFKDICEIPGIEKMNIAELVCQLIVICRRFHVCAALLVAIIVVVEIRCAGTVKRPGRRGACPRKNAETS